MNEKRYQGVSRNEWEKNSGPLLTREEVLYRIREYPDVFERFEKLSREFQEELVARSGRASGVFREFSWFMFW